MTNQPEVNYIRIAEAIDYIKAHFKEQPSLNEMATAVGISPFHFQRLFTEWAGVSPKKFMQYLSIEYAKKLLNMPYSTLLHTTHETGLSSTSRLHDLFVNIEAMTPGQFKNGGEELSINYCFSDSPFGKVIIASTHLGICHLLFEENEAQALSNLKRHLPNAKYQPVVDQFQQDALSIFQNNPKQLDEIKLHLNGTHFQLKVWQALLKIPLGNLTNYGDIAKEISQPKASRAVGTAIGSNPVSFLIPCHRVIQASGKIGGYRWGETRKSAMIGWEASIVDNDQGNTHK